MTLASISYGPIFPSGLLHHQIKPDGFVFASSGTIDAAGEKVAYLGEVMWADGGTHTMGSSSKIHCRTATITFANSGTNLRISIQDVIGDNGSNTQGLIPDGTADVYRDILGNAGVITASNTVYAIQLNTSGSKSIAHGARIAVLFELTTRSPSDSLQFSAIGTAGYMLWPSCRSGSGGTWYAAGGSHPLLLLEADDGTFGILAGSSWFTAIASTSMNASSTPDEIGLIFQVPFRCKVDAAFGVIGQAAGSVSGDGNWKLYSTPLGTPSTLLSASIISEQASSDIAVRPRVTYLGGETTLEPNTDYCIAVEATNTGYLYVANVTLESANHRPVLGFANCRKGSRSNGSGAFTEDTANIPLLGVRLSALDDGAGSAGGGLLTHPGMGGGARG